MSDTTRIQTHEHHKPCPVTQIKTEPNDEDANALAILLGVRYDPEPQAHSSGFYQSSCQVDDEEDDVVFEEKFPIDINRVPVTNRLQNVVEKDAKVPLPSPSKKKKAQKRKSEEHSSELFELERIISFYHYTDTDTYYLCKWVGYPYTQCTWEKFPEHEKKDVRTVQDAFCQRMVLCAILRKCALEDDEKRREWMEKHKDKIDHSRIYNPTEFYVTKTTFRLPELTCPHSHPAANIALLMSLQQWEHEINSINITLGVAPIYIENWADDEARPKNFTFSMFYVVHDSAREIMKHYHDKILANHPQVKSKEDFIQEADSQEDSEANVSTKKPEDGASASDLENALSDTSRALSVVSETSTKNRPRTYRHPYDKDNTLSSYFFNQGGFYDCPKDCQCSCLAPCDCEHRITSKLRQVPIVLFRTLDRGWSVRAASDIKTATFICEYFGEIMTIQESEKSTEMTYLFEVCKEDVVEVPVVPQGEDSQNVEKEESNALNPDQVEDDSQPPENVEGKNVKEKTKKSGKTKGKEKVQTEKVVIKDGLVVDACRWGNEARFVNHSCDPNMVAYHVKKAVYGDFFINTICFFTKRDIKKGEELTIDYKDPTYGDAIIGQCLCCSSKCKTVKKPVFQPTETEKPAAEEQKPAGRMSL